MSDVLRRLRGRNNEGVLLMVLIVLVVVMSLLNPAFLTPSTAFSILRNATVPMIFALAVLIVIITGGIDVSFAVVAIFSAYTAVSFFLRAGLDPGVPAVFGVAIAIGALLGLFNGFVIARFRLPTLIVTLGTQGLFYGILYTYIGSRYYAELPPSMTALSAVQVIDFPTDRGRAYLHVLVLLAVLLSVLVWMMLRFTLFGRSLYAIGGDAEAARRAGFRVVPTQMLVYVIVGALAAIAGVVHVTMSRSANPQDLVGGELDIIAAVVLGGASIFGGRGSVLGAVLGVLLVQVINNSLLLAGVPSAWLRAAVGVLLILGVGVQAVLANRRSRHIRTVDTADVDQTPREKVA
jgi:simple sugar transport system permease protein